MSEDKVNVRYMVDDVDSAVEFYTKHFGFTLGTNAPPAFADVVRGHLRVLLSGPQSSAGRPMPDGRIPALVAGTESSSWWTTSRPRSSACEPKECASATTSSPVREGNRS